ncbi:type IV secretory system conjugative DNA transfer family protein [Emticicia sp. BO119]|uniref:type IV secretory system conjugative DNA transfer family protein n=1 Tax=Emticicia sp. BO119 TaxID=2757768 RepID=UPI0015EFFFB6|nr:TraM recognition domain-containing protein [Emticicia sp. BO119]MBA4853752.1 TraM recognition domain-containing protein [Emticicia sp. BO119]
MNTFDLDKPLIEFPSGSSNGHWTIRHAVEGVQIFGGIGSGKSSGSGRTLALKYLKAGFGGLVLTVKPDEKEVWQDYCQLTGREKDLLILEPGGHYHFNFLQYEAAQASGQSITENMVEVLKTVIRAGEEKNGKSDDPFWETALDMLIFNVIDLCLLAYGQLSIQTLYDIVQTIPKPDQENKASSENSNAYHRAFQQAQAKVNEKVNDWYLQLSKETQDLMDEAGTLEMEVGNAVPEARLYNFVRQFFNENYISLSEKTRSIIDFTFSGFLFRLLREPIYSLFCRHDSNIQPEDCLDGKIILLNLPVKVYQKVGRDCQILFKYIWQRAMEKRSISANNRPLFLWADEAQNFLHEHDADYQATARSSRISTVYISQNLPNYYACMGGQKAEYRVKSFMGTLGTKIFHANADIETNKYASELIGDAYFVDESSTQTIGKEFSHGRGQSLKLERMVRPEDFVRLKTGGTLNEGKVEGYLHRQGDPVHKGLNHVKMTFKQQYQP